MKNKDYLLQQIENSGFIYEPELFISDNIEEVLNFVEIMDFIHHILKHNKNIIADLETEIKVTKQKISSPPSSKTEEIPSKNNYTQNKKPTIKDVENIVDFLHSQKEITIEILKEEEIPFIKLSIIRRMNKIKDQIQQKIYGQITEDITPLQEEIKIYQQLLEQLIAPNISETIINENRLIIFPNNKGTSSIYEDILIIEENRKEIKSMLEKMQSGHFTASRKVKSIVSIKEKLLEYTHPSGIRILYFILPNNKIAITKIFYKDKQKSTKIKSYYIEAANLYTQNSEYLNQIDTLESRLEQEQLYNQISSLLSDEPTLKKGAK